MNSPLQVTADNLCSKAGIHLSILTCHHTSLSRLALASMWRLTRDLAHCSHMHRWPHGITTISTCKKSRSTREKELKSKGVMSNGSKIRQEDFLRSYVTLRGPPLDSETGWTGELWSNRVLLILIN